MIELEPAASSGVVKLGTAEAEEAAIAPNAQSASRLSPRALRLQSHDFVLSLFFVFSKELLSED
jgi:hypothetical protein